MIGIGKILDQHDDCRVGAREMHATAGIVSATAHVPAIFTARRTAAKPAKTMISIPEHQSARIGDLRRLLRVETPGNIAQIDEVATSKTRM